jgi:putative protein kinase ArgK-like GTPase of G3E family
MDGQDKSPSNIQNQYSLLFPNVFIFPQEKRQVQEGQMEGEHVNEISATQEEGITSSRGEIEENESSEEATQEDNLRRSTQQTQPSIRLWDYVSHQVMYHIQDSISYNNISHQYRVFLSQITNQSEPTTFEEAKTSLVWCKAMKEELQALEKNNTWELIPLPKNKKTRGM